MTKTPVDQRLSSLTAWENEGPNVETPATAPTAPGHGPTGLESSNV